MPRKTEVTEDEDLVNESDFELQYLTEQRHEVKLSDEIDYFSLD